MTVPMYTPEDTNLFAEEFATLGLKHASLVEAFSKREYRTERACEYAVQGFNRRLFTLKECIELFFETIPLNLEGIPTEKSRQIATIATQAFLINVFGCVDNLARVWVEERNVRDKNDQPLPDKWIGMGGRYSRVRASFSPDFRAYLDSLSEWFSGMEKFRDALAHRISPYFPPYVIDPEDKPLHDSLGGEIVAAIRLQNFDRAAGLAKQQEELRFFRPYITHSFSEKALLLPVHPQMLADFNTIDEIARNLLLELAN